MRQNTHGNMEPSEPDDWNCSVDLDDVLKALYDLAHADALEGVLPLVAGWNGPADKPYAPHPPQLGAQIKTTCGRVYKLAEAIKQARDVLYRANVVPKQTA